VHRAHLEFVLGLHAQLPAEGNLCWSPYSVSAALGLVAAGARGPTHDELTAVLGDDLGGLVRDSASVRDAELAVANSLWMDGRPRFHEEYQQTVLGMPGGALHTTDFRHDPEGSRHKINDDVAQTTRGLIQELLAAGMITPETAAVIVNALYLKVAWRTAFPETETTSAPFRAPSGTRKVPTMRQRERMRYAAARGWRMVSLPTASEVVVDVLVPQLVGAPLTVDVLSSLYAASRATTVDLMLPRFRVESEAVLNDHLHRLGVVTAFTRDADFSGITNDSRIFIDLVVHKAVLRADEQGFEGAAATAVVMRTVSMELGEPVEFHVDEPFLVLVRHPGTGAIYFVTRVVEP
jgi:serine protease inhibitor